MNIFPTGTAVEWDLPTSDDIIHGHVVSVDEWPSEDGQQYAIVTSDAGCRWVVDITCLRLVNEETDDSVKEEHKVSFDKDAENYARETMLAGAGLNGAVRMILSLHRADLLSVEEVIVQITDAQQQYDKEIVAARINAGLDEEGKVIDKADPTPVDPAPRYHSDSHLPVVWGGEYDEDDFEDEPVGPCCYRCHNTMKDCCEDEACNCHDAVECVTCDDGRIAYIPTI